MNISNRCGRPTQLTAEVKKKASEWAIARKSWVKHNTTKQEEARKPSAYKITKRGEDFIQYWDCLPEYVEEHAPSKECPKQVYRLIRQSLCVDPSDLSHHTMVDYIKRFKNALPEELIEVKAYLQAIIEEYLQNLFIYTVYMYFLK